MNEDPVAQYLINWATADPRVRAVVWTSTRTNPTAVVDALSDYDIIFVVDDIAPFIEDEAWLGDFGPLLVVYRDPVHYEAGHPSITRVTQYEDGLKIDFHVMPVALWESWMAAPALPDELDVGYRVIVDKDDLTSGMRPPTYRAFIPEPPDEATYLNEIELFFHEGTYVAKNLWRDELIPATYSFDLIRTGHLRQMLEWRMEIDHEWSVQTGALGKGLKKHLPPDVWVAFEQTYAGADIEEIWTAFFTALELFRRVAMEVGEALGYAYPHEFDRRATAYFQDLQVLDHNAASFRRAVDKES
jgi:aminoglycoside 6-adenylyltransferase